MIKEVTLLQTLYLLNYNQYYNKIVKGQNNDSVDDYEDSIVEGPITATNFNPNDGITTSHTVNITEQEADQIDYLIVSNDNRDILSRWFIIQSKRELGSQYTLSLRRDLIVDFYPQVANSTSFIEKAILQTTANSLIYNSENSSVNQIKSAEIPLKDISNCGWIVAYIAKNYTGSETVKSEIVTYSRNQQTEYSYSFSDLAEGQELYGVIDNIIASFRADVEGSNAVEYVVRSDGTFTQYDNLADYNVVLSRPASPSRAGVEFGKAFGQQLDTFINGFYGYASVSNSTSKINTLLPMSGNLVKDSSQGIFYTFDLVKEPTLAEVQVNVPKNSEFYNLMSEIIRSNPFVKEVKDSSQSVYLLKALVNKYTVKNLEVVTGTPISMTIPAADRRMPLIDAPYDMLCLPYGTSTLIYRTPDDAGGKQLTGDMSNYTLNIAQQLATDLGGLSNYLYDIQLLPYCPCLEYMRGDVFYMGNEPEGIHYSLIYEGGTPVAYGLWAQKSSFSTNVYHWVDNPTDPIEFKVNNECNKYRLMSPNYAGAFEFSATKNGGIRNFEVNCTYKPLQPYIHINPVFGGLYGGDYDDNRGLICGGNFSLPVVNDAWTNYQIQNKSYQEAFNREVENMETTFDIKMEQQRIGAVIGTVTGGLAGAASGAMVGGLGGSVIGSGVGAGIGGVASIAANIAGAALDIQYANRLQDEALSYKKDMFNYSLQNIQALPNTMSRTSAFDINNKVFPVLEYYTCTDVEKEALRNRLIYNGMTIGTIGTVSDYIVEGESNYLQCQLIRFPADANVAADYHLVAEIANELHRGVYI